MSEIVNKTKLENASVDCQTLEDCVNGPAETKVTSRLGRQYWTLATIDSKVANVVSQADYALILIQEAQDQIVAITDTAQEQFDVKMTDLESQANTAINDWNNAIQQITIESLPALAVTTANTQTQQAINDSVGAKWYAKGGGYPINSRVMLDNGDIVKSTDANNTANPNIDMTGWKLINDWKRSPLTTAIQTVNAALDAQVVNIWEFAHLADKKGSEDSSEWDWSPAIQQAFIYCTNYQASSIVKKTCPKLYFPPGTYRMFSKVTIGGFGLYDGVPYQTTYNIVGSGLGSTVIASSLPNDYMFEFSNVSRFIVADLTFSGSNIDNSKCFKFGDENSITSSANFIHWCDFSRVYWTGFVQAVTIGRMYDSAFNNCAFRALRASNDIPSYYISVLGQNSDSSNQIAFFRTGFESVASKTTIFQEGSAFFKSTANNIEGSHYDFNFYACHFEGGGQNVKLLDLHRAFKWNFNGCYFVQTFVREDKALQPIISLDSCYSVTFDSCFVQEINNVTEWDSSLTKMIQIKGATNGLKFSDCYFKSSAINTTQTRSFDSVFDYSGATIGQNSFIRKNCIVNNFTAVASDSYSVYANPNNTSRRHYSYVDSNSSLVFSYTNNDTDKSARGSVSLALDENGQVQTYKDIYVGGAKTTAGDQKVNFVTNGDGVVKGSISTSSTGVMTVNAAWLTLRSNAGASDIVLEASVVRPNASGKALGTNTYRWDSTYLANWTIYQHIIPTQTATSNIGSASSTVNNIYTQNAVTVVSDERHKSNIRTIDDELLDAWGTLDFKMWQLNAAVEEKGTENARWHTGLIAQQVKDALTNAGLDWTKYGLITYESWESDEEKEAGELYMLRMEECFAVESAYQRRRLDRIEAILSA